MFYQRASGTVTLKVKQGSPHCGVDHNAVNITYKIELTFDDGSLDNNGFLLDNTAFKGYWTALSTVELDISCERLCEKVAHDIADMTTNDGLRKVRVSVSPFPDVENEYEYFVRRRGNGRLN